MPVCRVIIDLTPCSGAWNMAVDEVLLESSVVHGTCSLRWYCWDRPTISLGYFQDAASVPPTAELHGLTVVRRLSGGGAIVHHHELTYSCAVPAAHEAASAPRELYTLIHRRIIAGLEARGIAATLRGATNRAASGEFLCFGRGDDFDIVRGGSKIMGSAQRRRKGAILQHGSLVLQVSPHAPQFPGIFDLTGCTVEPAELAADLANRVGKSLADELVPGSLTAEESAEAWRVASLNTGLIDREQRGGVEPGKHIPCRGGGSIRRCDFAAAVRNGPKVGESLVQRRAIRHSDRNALILFDNLDADWYRQVHHHFFDAFRVVISTLFVSVRR